MQKLIWKSSRSTLTTKDWLIAWLQYTGELELWTNGVHWYERNRFLLFNDFVYHINVVIELSSFAGIYL